MTRRNGNEDRLDSVKLTAFLKLTACLKKSAMEGFLGMCSLEDGVCVQVHAAHVRWGVIQIKVAGVHSNNEWTGGTQHVSQCQGAQRNIWAWPVERENHLIKTKIK